MSASSSRAVGKIRRTSRISWRKAKGESAFFLSSFFSRARCSAAVKKLPPPPVEAACVNFGALAVAGGFIPILRLGFSTTSSKRSSSRSVAENEERREEDFRDLVDSPSECSDSSSGTIKSSSSSWLLVFLALVPAQILLSMHQKREQTRNRTPLLLW